MGVFLGIVESPNLWGLTGAVRNQLMKVLLGSVEVLAHGGLPRYCKRSKLIVVLLDLMGTLIIFLGVWGSLDFNGGLAGGCGELLKLWGLSLCWVLWRTSLRGVFLVTLLSARLWRSCWVLWESQMRSF